MAKFTVLPFDREAIKDHLRSTKFNATLESILALLGEGPRSCNWVILEENYLDEDYLAEYSAYYCTVFLQVPSRCKRLHFFHYKEQPDLANLAGIADRSPESYLGFMVWRPTRRQEVGRTILSARLLEENAPHAPNRRRFLHCVAEYTAHLRDAEFSIRGAPFIQGDMQVGVCAHAALWMASRYMSSRMGDRAFTVAQINLLAKRTNTSGRLCPADYGLETGQILAALEGMGLAFHVYSAGRMEEAVRNPALPPGLLPPPPPPAQDGATEDQGAKVRPSTRWLADIAYRYIESGLPVLLLTDNHVMVGIGHTLEQNSRPQNAAGLLIERIPSFLIQNDNSGPYQEMPIWELPKEDKKEIPPGEIEARRPLVFSDVTEVVSIMPHEVTLCGAAAERVAFQMVWSIPSMIMMAPEAATIRAHWAGRPEISHLWDSQPNGKPIHLLGRTYLLRSYEWLQYIRQLNYSPHVADYLMNIDYPRYVWITEVTTGRAFDRVAQHPEEHACLGFVVLDSTINSDANAAIVAHIGDVLVQFRATVREAYGTEETAAEPRRAYPHVIFDPNSAPIPFKDMDWKARCPAKHGGRSNSTPHASSTRG